MINFLDELDQKLSLDDFEESQISEVHDFICKRMMADKNQQLVANGELTREVAMVLNQRMIEGNGKIEDLQALSQDIRNIKNLYNVDKESIMTSPGGWTRHATEGQD